MKQKIGLSGHYKVFEITRNETTENLKFPEIMEHAKLTQEFDNLVPDVFLQSLATNLVTAGGSLPATDELRVTYIAVGTGSTAPVAGNTTLETEVFRSSIDTQVRDGKIAKTGMLIGFSEANSNTLTEVGAFAGNASGTVDTGTLSSRALFPVSIVKDNTKTVYIEISHTFNDA